MRAHQLLRFRTHPDTRRDLMDSLRGAVPYYHAPGGITIRLLQSVEDADEFIEVVQYGTSLPTSVISNAWRPTNQ